MDVLADINVDVNVEVNMDVDDIDDDSDDGFMFMCDATQLIASTIDFPCPTIHTPLSMTRSDSVPFWCFVSLTFVTIFFISFSIYFSVSYSSRSIKPADLK